MDHLQTNLFLTIQNPDYTGYQVPTVHCYVWVQHEIVETEIYGHIVGHYNGHKGLNKIWATALTYQCGTYSMHQT